MRNTVTHWVRLVFPTSHNDKNPVHFPNNRRIERKAGRLAVLAPRQSRPFTVDFVLHDTKSSVTTAAERIQKIQNGRATQVDQEPETWD